MYALCLDIGTSSLKGAVISSEGKLVSDGRIYYSKEVVWQQAMSELKNRESAEKHRIETETAAAKELAAELEGKTVKLTANAGSNGKLFGSVTSKDVTSAINSTFGTDIDKKKVSVEDIKNFGIYPVEVKLYGGISAKLFVSVGE